MKKIEILLSCLFVSIATYSADRSTNMMRSIAQSHFNGLAKSRQSQKQQKTRVDGIIEVASTPSYGVYESDGAFVVIGRDNRSPQILGYSNTPFDETNLAPGLKWWLGIMDGALQNVDYSSRTTRTIAEFTPVENFMETTWNQSNPYNALCPLIDGKLPPTGCVATAMSQILYYHKYPERSTGMGYYKTNANNTEHKQQLSTVFNWDAMLPSYAISDYSEESKIAVAELMRDCGLATGMIYGSSSSGAHSRVAANGLISNLGFTPSSLRFADRAYYSDEEWMGIVYNELAEKRPIYYGGADLGNQSGHAFVLSGVDSEGLVYVNWGWGGSGNGFYDISYLKPNISSNSDNYSDQQDMIYGISPNPDETMLEPKYSEFLSENKYDIEAYDSDVMKGYVRAVFSRFYNGYINGFQGKISLCLENQAGKTTSYTLYDISAPDIVPIYYYLNQDDAKSTLKNLSKLEAGTYKAYIGSKSVNDVKYQPVRCPGGPIFFTIVKDSDGNVVVKGNNYSGIHSITKTDIKSSHHIYDLHGRPRGTDPSALPKGIYIINGKKVVK